MKAVILMKKGFICDLKLIIHYYPDTVLEKRLTDSTNSTYLHTLVFVII